MLFQNGFAQTMIQLIRIFHVADCQPWAIKGHGALRDWVHDILHCLSS